jgi:hypothetical protein
MAAASLIVLMAIAGSATRAYAAIPRDPSCASEESVKSTSGDEPTTLRFVNNTGATLQTLWLDYDGERVFYEQIQPHSSYDQKTWVTHPWIVADLDGGCYLLFVTDGTTNRVTINELGDRASSTSVSCDRDMTETLLAVLQCTARVSDISPQADGATPSGTVAWTATAGSFSGTGSCTLGGTSRTGVASCMIEYRASSSDVPIGSPAPMTAKYSGDAVFAPSQDSPGRPGPASPGEKLASGTEVTCDFGVAGVDYTCQALVADATGNIGAKPTGIVRWAATAGTFPNGDSCTLTTTLTGASRCTVVFRGATDQPIGGVTASYSGDTVFGPSSDGFNVGTVGDKLASATAVTCNRDTSETSFALLRCNALVADASGAAGGLKPSGTVTWTARVGSFLGGATCTLTGSTSAATSCMVEYRATSSQVPSGSVPPVSANYQGDAMFEPSSGAPRLGPRPPDSGVPVGVVVGAAVAAAALAAGLALKARLGGLLHPGSGGAASGTGTSTTGSSSSSSTKVDPDPPGGPDPRLPHGMNDPDSF